MLLSCFPLQLYSLILPMENGAFDYDPTKIFKVIPPWSNLGKMISIICFISNKSSPRLHFLLKTEENVWENSRADL